MEKVLELIQRELWPFLKPLWDSIVFWRICSLSLMFVVAAAYKYRDRLIARSASTERRSHDIAIFESADKLLDERTINEMIDDLLSDHSYSHSQSAALRRFLSFSRLTSNNFLNRELQRRVADLVEAIDSLHTFLMRFFFPYPEDQRGWEDGRSCLWPRGNVDRGGSGDPEDERRYSTLESQLRELVATVQRAYREYRMAIKKRFQK